MKDKNKWAQCPLDIGRNNDIMWIYSRSPIWSLRNIFKIWGDACGSGKEKGLGGGELSGGGEARGVREVDAVWKAKIGPLNFYMSIF